MSESQRLTDFANCAGCAGKLPAGGIARLLRHLPPVTDPNLLVGTATHDDAGVYRVSDELALVQTVDFFPPVVDDPFAYGQIAAANALSDVYAMGGTPKTALNLVGYPDDVLDDTWLGRILEGGAERCTAAGVTIIGGHTLRDREIKFGCAVTGFIHPNRIVTNAGAKPGDLLVLTKPLGTGLVTTAAKRRQCPEEVLRTAIANMTRLNDTARDAMLAADARAATDITGFGLAGHGYEMASGSGVTLHLRLGSLPLLPGVAELVKGKFFPRASRSNREFAGPHLKLEADGDAVEYLFDPQTSGGLLVSLPPDRLDRFHELLPAAAVIGEVLPRGDAALVVTP